MPIAWFRHDATAILDLRLRRLADLLDMRAVHVHGHLISLRCWVALCRPDGDLTGLNEADIEAAAEWGELQPEGAFARAALEVGLLQRGEDGELRLMPLGATGPASTFEELDAAASWVERRSAA